MSARRMAENQPDSFVFSAESEKEAEFWLAKYPESRKRSAVIPLLWVAQKQEGWVTRPAMERIAERLDMAYVRVLEVATFYTMFNLGPVGENLVQLCGTTPCMLRGANELKAVCEKKIGPRGTTSADGKFSWMEVECLGACANAPMVQISNAKSDHYYEDLTPESLEQLLDAFARGEDPEAGPQIARQTSAPEGEAVTLTDESLFDGSRAKRLTSLPNAPEGWTPSGADQTPGKPFDSRDNQAAAAKTPADDTDA